MNLAQAMARALADVGITDVFALMGNGNLRMIHHLVTDHGIVVHHARHESAAVGAADGYARVSGDVAVATITHGPGFTNGITALITAQRARTPLVLLTTDSSHIPAASSPFAAIQALDPDPLLGTLGIHVIRSGCESGYTDVGAALAQARATRSPVVVVIPAGDDGRPFTGELVPHTPEAVQPGTVLSDSRVFDEAVRRGAATLMQAQRPVVVAGRGAATAEAEAVIIRLATRIGAVLTTSLGGLGMFTDHPAHAGIAGGFSSEDTARLLRETDCVLVLGASLNPFTTRRNELFSAASIIQCDTDPAAFGRHRPADIAICGDAATVAAELLAVMSSDGRPPRQTPVISAETGQDVSTPGHLDPRAICRVVDRSLPRERTVVVDTGHFTAFPILHTRVGRPGGLVWPIDFGAVGSSIGAAVGAAAARPGAVTVHFVGDGGFFMSLGDFAVAVTERLPLVVICLNDEAYGSELVHLEAADLPGDQAVFQTPDLAAVAGSLGFTATRAEMLEDVAAAIAAWDPSSGPLFVDCPITRDVRSPVYAHT
jgi:thiamine pyrophosphate-dependent acetolactate synthase large subunit-like protein